MTAAAAEGSAGPAVPAGFDYDELARRLLVQVVRCISGAEGRGTSVLSSSEVVLLRRLLSPGSSADEAVGA
jgi:hypothetical protein